MKIEAPRWYHVGLNELHSDVFVCVGTRMQMMSTGAKYLQDNTGWSVDEIDNIGRDLASKLPYGEDPKVFIDMIPVDDGACDRLVYFIRLDSFSTGIGDISTLSSACLDVALSISVKLNKEDRKFLCQTHEILFKDVLHKLCFGNIESKSSVNVNDYIFSGFHNGSEISMVDSGNNP